MKFSELQLNANVLEALDAMRFDECTPIQEQAIPIILEGKDLIAVAQTGTGKTAAFLLPVLNKLSEGKHPEDAINCVIMSPTRELAQQIDQQMEGFSYFMPASSVAVYGGNDGILFEQQKKGLTLGADVVIATPGRLIAHLSLGYVDLSKVSYFILDEADRMLDMGFIHDIKRILPKLPKEKQTLFFSATMPDTIVTLTKSLLKNPVKIYITPKSSTVDSINQVVYFVEKKEKSQLLISILQKAEDQSVLIFSRTKHNADKIVKILGKAGIGSQAIHGNKSQAARQSALGNFKSGKTRVMVATDIASRGIDISELPMVINYDLPDVPETYVHRIGRTGRAGNEGTALTFCSQEERKLINDIQKLTGKKLNRADIAI